MPHLKITEVILVYCKTVIDYYQQDSRVLYTFVPNEPFGQLLETSPTNFIFLKVSNSEAIDVWFSDQSSQTLEIEGRINLSSVIK